MVESFFLVDKPGCQQGENLNPPSRVSMQDCCPMVRTERLELIPVIRFSFLYTAVLKWVIKLDPLLK